MVSFALAAYAARVFDMIDNCAVHASSSNGWCSISVVLRAFIREKNILTKTVCRNLAATTRKE